MRDSGRSADLVHILKTEALRFCIYVSLPIMMATHPANRMKRRSSISGLIFWLASTALCFTGDFSEERVQEYHHATAPFSLPPCSSWRPAMHNGVDGPELHNGFTNYEECRREIADHAQGQCAADGAGGV